MLGIGGMLKEITTDELSSDNSQDIQSTGPDLTEPSMYIFILYISISIYIL